MNCPRCGAPVYGPFCGNCGLQVRAVPHPATGPQQIPPTAPSGLSRKTALLVAGGVVGLVLLVVAGFLVTQYAPRATRPTDAVAFANELESQGYASIPYVLVQENEHGTVVYARTELSQDNLGGGVPGDWEEQLEEVLWLLWEYLPGHFDLAVAAAEYDGSHANRYMDRLALRGEFGARPSGLDNAPVAHDGSDPTDEEPGECVYAADRGRHCDRPPGIIDAPQTLELVRRTCPSAVEPRSLAEPAAVEWWEGESSAFYLVGEVKEDRPGGVVVGHGTDPERYLSVSCFFGEAEEYALYTRREYEAALR